MRSHVSRTDETAAAPREGRQAQAERFETLVAPHIPALTRYAVRTCSGRDVAQDVVQETLLRAWRCLHQVREPERIRAWLFRILRNERARALAKAYSRGIEVELDGIASPEAAPDLDLLSIPAKIAAMPEKFRVQLVLFAIEG